MYVLVCMIHARWLDADRRMCIVVRDANEIAGNYHEVYWNGLINSLPCDEFHPEAMCDDKTQHVSRNIVVISYIAGRHTYCQWTYHLCHNMFNTNHLLYHSHIQVFLTLHANLIDLMVLFV